MKIISNNVNTLSVALSEGLGIGRLTGWSPVQADHAENQIIPVPGQSISASLHDFIDSSFIACSTHDG